MKKVLYWILAVIITLAAVIYQRKTGPTYDKKITVNIDDTTYDFKLIRSHGGKQDCKIELHIPDNQVSGIVEYKKFPTNDDWATIEMTRETENLTAELPHLPPAGKYEYYITLVKNGKNYELNEGTPVVIRYKGAVPPAILIPHILLMFIAMLLGNLAGILAIFKETKFKFYTTITLITLFFGGLIFGPWVQYYAFDEAWAGVPFAWDLTDNKTLVAFLFWVLAFAVNRKKERPVFTIVASVVMLLVYSIPHSMYGSQLDPETGEIIQGWIQLFFI
ncbi:hypothetical protein OU798_21490 [Prolixibacteraceae bacterium Z1-6]|uniref:Uncharacterized protein n=1 Tax=Draconibacterium aestuarii TaxID=2998507 RepID=A0A9X3F9L7_9BACT|nr:hypothetical protein [Prolixibacteraceae bacterium Z1-6]